MPCKLSWPAQLFDDFTIWWHIQECGPRFTLKLRSLQHGTFDTKGGEFEWVHKVMSSPNPLLFVFFFLLQTPLSFLLLTASCTWSFLKTFVSLKFRVIWIQVVGDFSYNQAWVSRFTRLGQAISAVNCFGRVDIYIMHSSDPNTTTLHQFALLIIVFVQLGVAVRPDSRWSPFSVNCISLYL